VGIAGRPARGRGNAGSLSRARVEEELGIAVEIGPLLDCWVYEVSPQKEVVIVTYGLRRRDKNALRVSGEHSRIGLFSIEQLEQVPLPRGYHRAIRVWRNRLV
jgi:hypothetical protein